MRECGIDKNLFSSWLGFGASVVVVPLLLYLCVRFCLMLLLRKAEKGMGKLVVFLHVVRMLALLRVALVSISQPLPLCCCCYRR